MDEMIWRKCPHCGKDRYCTDNAMVQHVEDCPERPTLKAKRKLCPKCASIMQHAGNGVWACAMSDCDFTLEVVPGGKIS